MCVSSGLDSNEKKNYTCARVALLTAQHRLMLVVHRVAAVIIAFVSLDIIIWMRARRVCHYALSPN